MSKAHPGVTRRAIRRLADPRMVSGVSFTITLFAWLISIYPQLLRGEAALTWPNALSWFAVVFTGQIALFSLLLVAKRLWLSREWSTRHPSIAVLTVLVSLIVGLSASSVVASAFGTQRDPIIVGLEFLPLGMLVMVIAGSVSVAIAEHRRTLGELHATRSKLEASMERGREQLASEREGVLHEADVVIDTALKKIDGPLPELVAYLHEASEKVLRPLSHRLVNDRSAVPASSMPTPPPRWREVFTLLSQRSLIAPKALSAVVLFLFWRLSVRETGPVSTPSSSNAAGVSVSIDLESFGISIAQLTIVVLSTFLIASVANETSTRILRRLSDPQRWLTQVITVLAVTVLSLATVGGLLVATGMPMGLVLTPANAALVTVAVVGVTVFVGVSRALTSAQDDVKKQLGEVNNQLEWNLGRINQEIWHQRREMGLALHGTLRSALIASAMQLQAAGDGVEDTHLAEVRSRLEAAKREFSNGSQHVSPIDAFHQLAQLWEGACEIAFQWDEETISRLEADPVSCHSVVQVVDEACANAITHGNAKRVQVSLDASGEYIEIMVRNDGDKPKQIPVSGLGSSLLDEVAARWTLEASEDETLLRAHMPVV